MMTPITILTSLLFGLCAAYIAKRQGKEPIRWFLIGFLFGALGLFGLILFKKPKKKRASPQKKRGTSKPLPQIGGPIDKLWYYLDQAHERHGPMSHQALTKALRSGTISLKNYVWNEEMSEWRALEEFIPMNTRQKADATSSP